MNRENKPNKDVSIKRKSFLYAIAGFIIVNIVADHFMLALLAGFILYKFGMRLFEPSQVRTIQTPDNDNRTVQNKENESPLEQNSLEIRGKDILRRIDKMNFKIENLNIHKLLSDIEDVAYKIINALKEDAEKESQLLSFVIHYLPAVENITTKYCTIVDNDISNTDSERFIEDFVINLEEIRHAFQNLLEGLYKNDIDEANVEMDVLKSELKSKGLLDSNEFNL